MVPHELYCLAEDPDEKVNLIDYEKYQYKVREMRMRLEKWFVKYVNPEIDGAREPVFGAGQALRVSGEMEKHILKI